MTRYSGNAELAAELPDLVLEEQAQRLDDLLEVHIDPADRRHCGGS
jgi:hypothetical protein